MGSDGCDCSTKPRARRKWRHRLYICDCGQAWRAVFVFTYASDGYEWKKWPS